MKSNFLYIRPSHALSYDDCGFAYYLKYVLGVKQNVTPANLPFGTAVHEACTGFILAEATGASSYDPVQVFRDMWCKSLETEALDFSSSWGADELTQTGLRLVDLFPAAWEATGYAPLIDDQGPVVERRFQAKISDDVVLTGQPDVVAMDDEGGVIPLDIKTSAQAYGEEFLLASEQLTDYQILVEANGEQLGLGEDGVANVGFFEGIKRKVSKTGKGKGPQFLQPLISSARSEERKAERRQKLVWMAEDVRRGRFPKRPRMAYNSPCNLCEFADYCLNGNTSGLIFPATPQQKIGLQATAPLI
jgi:hypothetical protein